MIYKFLVAQTSFLFVAFTFLVSVNVTSCKKSEQPSPRESNPQVPGFYFGVDISSLNQVLDHGGVFKDQGEIRDPYRILADHGANLARFRLWHTPTWTQEAYGERGTQPYNDLADVEKGMQRAKEQGMALFLNFHYSDRWADPSHQFAPDAWKHIQDLEVLKDSVYQYTYNTLTYLDSKGLMPALVQLGNETNCGLFYTETPEGFPGCNICKDHWMEFGEVINSGIRAVRDASANSRIKTKVMLHIADPTWVDWWFGSLIKKGKVTDFDIIAFSYYPLWLTHVTLKDLAALITDYKNRYQKEVLIVETGYAWTPAGNDAYANMFDTLKPLPNYPYTPQGQHDVLKDMAQHVIDAGGLGIVYWEPAWISAEVRDPWGQGSFYENATFFDFHGNTLIGIDYMKANYKTKTNKPPK